MQCFKIAMGTLYLYIFQLVFALDTFNMICGHQPLLYARVFLLLLVSSNIQWMPIHLLHIIRIK